MHERWPEMPYEDWKDTAATLHMWTQIVGKIRLAQWPWVNHSWHVTLYVSPCGLTTGPIPYGEQTFQIDFDFIDHQLLITSSSGQIRVIPLKPQTTADFHAAVTGALRDLGLEVGFSGRPNEVEQAVPFAEDVKHASYDAHAVHRFWCALREVDMVFKRFRARFIGKASPSHFFWGSFDLAVSRFSGRPAPAHPGGYPNMPLDVMQEAYSHEVSSTGFWPGGEMMPYPMFYSYAYPTPEGFADAVVAPEAAAWNTDLGEFVLPYEDVRNSDDPEQTLMDFLQTTYDAAARCADWDVAAFEQTFRRE